MLLLMGIAPLLPWRRASRDHLVHNFLVPVAATLAGALVMLVIGVRNIYAVVGLSLCLFVLATIVQEFVRGALARHRATGDAYPLALAHLVRRNNRRYGGYIVHLGIILIGAGVIGSHVYQQQTEAALQPGQSLTIGNYTITASGLNSYDVADAKVVEAPLDVNGSDLRPQKIFFNNFPDQPSTKVGLQSVPLEDLYVVLAAWDGDGPTAQGQPVRVHQSDGELDLDRRPGAVAWHGDLVVVGATTQRASRDRARARRRGRCGGLSG